MNSILTSIMSFIMLIQALFGLGGIKDVGGFEKNDWMKDIDGTKYISEISIPGTHNSGALYEPAYGVAKCQKYTIGDQLDMGVRFLDVRASVSFGKLKISHGIVYQGQNFEKFVNACYDFLKENPSETVIFSLRNEDGEGEKNSKFISLLKKEINSNENMWYTQNKLPKLYEVRGRLVLINRFDRECDLGLNAAHSWSNNSALFSIYNDGYFINVQDVYAPETIDIKKDAVISFIRNNNRPAVVTPALCINFLSAVTSTGNIPETSAEMNEFFKEYSKTNPPFYGCMVFDYITSDLCDIVINANK